MSQSAREIYWSAIIADVPPELSFHRQIFMI